MFATGQVGFVRHTHTSARGDSMSGDSVRGDEERVLISNLVCCKRRNRPLQNLTSGELLNLTGLDGVSSLGVQRLELFLEGWCA